LRVRLERTTRQALAGRRRHLAQLASSYALREPRRVVRQWAQRLDDFRESLHAAAEDALRKRRQELAGVAARLRNRHPARELERRRAHLAHLAARLRTLGPQGTLDRGYALVLNAEGHPLTRVEKNMEGRTVRLVLSKGAAGAQLKQIEPGKSLLEVLEPGLGAKPVEIKKKKPRRKAGDR
jgi:exodeoxyribonuclease VII large subunit